MDYAYELFGDYAFRRVNNGRRGPVNKAIFEIWSKVINELSDSELDILLKNRDSLKQEFFSLFNDYKFINTIKAADKTSVNFRFASVKEIVNKILKEYRDD